MFFAPGTKNFKAEERNYFVSTLSALFIKQISYKIGIGGGIDVFYKESGIDKVKSNESDFNKTLSAGVYFCNDWTMTEKFKISASAGLYIKRHKENDEPYILYERIAAKYHLYKNFFAGIGIKINGNAADYLEWTIGYTFKKDKNIYQ